MHGVWKTSVFNIFLQKNSIMFHYTRNSCFPWLLNKSLSVPTLVYPKFSFLHFDERVSFENSCTKCMESYIFGAKDSFLAHKKRNTEEIVDSDFSKSRRIDGFFLIINHNIVFLSTSVENIRFSNNKRKWWKTLLLDS